MPDKNLFRQIFYLLICSIMAGSSCIAQVLNIPEKHQEQDQWCWDATSQAVLEYYGFTLTQTEIASYATDGANTWNYIYGSSTNPTRKGIDLILNHFGAISSAGLNNWSTLESVTSEIAARRPVPIRWGWDGGTSGHILLIHGVADTMIYIMDPWYGPSIETYAWVRAGSGHTWTHGLKINTTPPSSADDGSGNSIKKYFLCQNYPNPFNPSTKISFFIGMYGRTSLRVYDILGREVAALVNEVKPAGDYQVEWNAAGFPSGVYFYRLQAGSFTETKKLLLLK